MKYLLLILLTIISLTSCEKKDQMLPIRTNIQTLWENANQYSGKLIEVEGIMIYGFELEAIEDEAYLLSKNNEYDEARIISIEWPTVSEKEMMTRGFYRYKDLLHQMPGRLVPTPQIRVRIIGEFQNNYLKKGMPPLPPNQKPYCRIIIHEVISAEPYRIENEDPRDIE